MATVKITDETFKADVLGSELPVVVDFWAEWCGPCKAMSPALENLSEEYADKAVIAKMNIEDSPDTPVDLRVMGVPTLVIFKGGEEVARYKGGLSQSKLAEWVSEHV